MNSFQIYNQHQGSMYKNNNALGQITLGSNGFTRNLNQSFDEVLAGASHHNTKHKRHSSFGSQNSYQPYKQQLSNVMGSSNLTNSKASFNHNNLKSKLLSPQIDISGQTSQQKSHLSSILNEVGSSYNVSSRNHTSNEYASGVKSTLGNPKHFR